MPFKFDEYISKNIDVFIIGMGSGTGCDAQYLFAEDILGYNKGHIPRHAKVYSDIAVDYELIKKKAEKAFKSFKEDVISTNYPSTIHDIDISESEYESFVKNLKN